MKSILSNDGHVIRYDKNTVDDLAHSVLDIYQQNTSLPTDIPLDPDEFYRDFGLLEHPVDGRPVPHLTSYQRELWLDGQRHKRRLCVKSQKIGISTSALMEDFQHAITDCKGKEILIIAQTYDHAKNHLLTLRKMVINSTKYAQFLVSRPTDLLLRDEVTKVSVIYVQNPDNIQKPTRIIALGPRPGSIWSWKEVKHIHMSDIAAQDQMVDDSETFGAAFSRLANTNGSMLIETPPRGPSGKIYDIYEHSKLKKGSGIPEAEFAVREYPASLAVEAGLITQDFLDAERERLGPAYDMYYACDFYNSANTWYSKDLFQYGKYGEDME